MPLLQLVGRPCGCPCRPVACPACRTSSRPPCVSCRANWRPGPCCGLRPALRRSWRTSTVNQSQSATARMNPAGASPWPVRLPACARMRGQDAADIDDEHHRIAPLHARARVFDEGADTMAGRASAGSNSENAFDGAAGGRSQEGLGQRGMGRGHGTSFGHVRFRRRRHQHVVFDDRPQAPAPARSSASPRATPNRSAATTKSGPCVGSVPARGLQALLARKRCRRSRAPAPPRRSGRTTSPRPSNTL